MYYVYSIYIKQEKNNFMLLKLMSVILETKIF